jgi:F-type H+-transporting ATPase subunit delta
MNNTVAKRYVKALMESFEGSQLGAISKELGAVSEAFGSSKFKTIISSPDVTKEAKLEFVLSLLSKPSQKLTNFITLIAEHKRLTFLKAIAEELEFQISLKNNKFEGKIYSNSEISKEQIESLEKSFGKKFGAQIDLIGVKSDSSGLKIEINDLGVETSFSLERLKAQMAEHILKAI